MYGYAYSTIMHSSSEEDPRAGMQSVLLLGLSAGPAVAVGGACYYFEAPAQESLQAQQARWKQADDEQRKGSSAICGRARSCCRRECH